MLLRRLAFLVCMIALMGANAFAADLPAQTRLGAIFAETYEPRPAPERVYVQGRFAPEIDVRPLVNGYYGKPGSYDYRPYYGSSDAYTRLPYACGFYGYC
jgi:hypothetical protein